jgi:sulfatase maturation enzyme AslB (radical SAM superfamily)
MNPDYRIPKRLQIETIFACNAKCVMCFVGRPESRDRSITRRKGIMPEKMFRDIIDSLEPYKQGIEKVDLFGLGEPLLDKFIFDRIKYVKKKGFKNIAISTNADLLDKKKQDLLLETEIETVIFSIDGIIAETHENIRIGLDYDNLVKNCLSLIKKRNEGNWKTRFVVRFIRQDANKDEWERYKAFWGKKLAFDRNDLLIVYDVNTMGGSVEVSSYSKKDLERSGLIDPVLEEKPCHMVTDRLIILKDGSVPLCCEDTPTNKFNFGNVSECTPIEIFNNKKFTRVRNLHLDGKKNDLSICNDCTLLYSELNTTVIQSDQNPADIESERIPTTIQYDKTSFNR